MARYVIEKTSYAGTLEASDRIEELWLVDPRTGEPIQRCSEWVELFWFWRDYWFVTLFGAMIIPLVLVVIAELFLLDYSLLLLLYLLVWIGGTIAGRLYVKKKYRLWRMV